MNRVMLTAVLTAPLFIVGALYVYANNAAEHAREKRLRAVALAMEAKSQAQPSKPETAPGANMVRPESLAQGFTIVVKDLTGLATNDSPIHIASSHNGWDPSDVKQKLDPRSDLRWQIVLPKPKSDAPLAFKFTRGNWDLEELDANLSAIANRELPMIDASKLAPGEKPVLEFEVVKWGDQRPNAAARPDLDPYYELKASGTIKRLQVAGGGVPALRDVLVLLPEGYDDPANKDRSYPVLYLQDGQNLFMHMPNIPAEWGVDETVLDLTKKGAIEPVIVVGIPHAGSGRTSEYLPVAAIEGVEPRGKQYIDFVVTEVMPRVERAFRVKTGPESTTIGGSSLGALIALEAATTRPDKFGGVLLESMSLLSEKANAIEHFKKAKSWPKKIYFAMGKQEGGTDPNNAELNTRHAAAAEEFGRYLKAQSGVESLVIVEDGVHNEEAWAKRFPRAITFFYGKK